MSRRPMWPWERRRAQVITVTPETFADVWWAAPIGSTLRFSSGVYFAPVMSSPVMSTTTISTGMTYGSRA